MPHPTSGKAIVTIGFLRDFLDTCGTTTQTFRHKESRSSEWSARWIHSGQFV